MNINKTSKKGNVQAWVTQAIFNIELVTYV